MKLPSDLVSTDIRTPLGRMRLAASASGLAGAWFHDQRHAPDPALTRQWKASDHHPVLQAATQQLQAYFDGERPVFDLPIDLSHGTAFQRAVWRALLSIPPGQTVSYGDLAGQLGKPAAVRAVGAAVGRNPVSIVVPCHRVLGARGELTGYAGGLPRKQALLRLEADHLPLSLTA